MSEPSVGTPPVNPALDRLDSWKEIAAYLKRDVTTVQRWEKREGMPVHRHLMTGWDLFTRSVRNSMPGCKAADYVWKRKRKKNLAAEPPADGEVDVRPTGTSRARLWLVLGGVAVTRAYCRHLRYAPGPRWAYDPTQNHVAGRPAPGQPVGRPNPGIPG